MNPVVCIAGPTASGKSAWAISLAKTLNGEIVNADALQVYRDLRILSARPGAKEMQDVPHHLFGHVEGSQRYSVGAWLDAAVPVILDILVRQRTPILVGGTGLYFKALTQGLAAVPKVSSEDFAKAQAILDDDGIGALREKAEKLDPRATARVLGDDPQRLLRIVSVAVGTEKPLSAWQAQTRPIIPKGYWHGAVLMPDRQALYGRINDRYEDMVEQGGLEEAKAVLAKDYSSDVPLMKAIGLPPLLRFLCGETDFDTALETSKRDTRRFAKRQYTWFRGQAADWPRIEVSEDRLAFENSILGNVR